jgi:hypothetical protein
VKILIPSLNANLLCCLQSLNDLLIEYDVVIATDNTEFDFLIRKLKGLIPQNNIKIYNSELTYDSTTHSRFEIFLKELIKVEEYCYILPTMPDYINHVIASLNSKFNLPGIKLEQSALCNKEAYYKIFETIGIPYPKTFIDNTSLKFPVVVKPSAGTGSIGVKVIFNNEQLTQFFDIDKHALPKIEFWKQGYFDFNSNYIIQEFIEGELITVSGRVVGSQITFDSIFDIESSPPPWCTELVFRFPSKISRSVIEKIKEQAAQFLQHIQLNDSPFLFDVIISDTDFYFIDFGMRVTNNPQKPLHSLCKEYTGLWVISLLNNQQYQPIFDGACIYHNFNFPAGTISNIECKNNTANELVLPDIGKRIYPSRHDMLANEKGYFIIADKSITEVSNRANKLLQSICIEYKND